MAAFAVALKPVGYPAIAAFVIVATALISGERNWFWIAFITFCGSIGIQYGFSLLGTHF